MLTFDQFKTSVMASTKGAQDFHVTDVGFFCRYRKPYYNILGELEFRSIYVNYYAEELTWKISPRDLISSSSVIAGETLEKALADFRQQYPNLI